MGFMDWFEKGSGPSINDIGNTLADAAGSAAVIAGMGIDKAGQWWNESSTKDKLNGAAMVVGTVVPIPVVADGAEILLSAGATAAGIYADPENWKKELAEGSANVVVAAVPIPGFSAGKKAAELAMKKAGKELAQAGAKEAAEAVAATAAKQVAEEAAKKATSKLGERSILKTWKDELFEYGYSLAEPIYERGVESTLSSKEKANYPAGAQIIDQSTLLKSVITAAAQQGALETNEKGQIVGSENNSKLIYKEYQRSKEMLEKEGIKVHMEPSHIINKILPAFYELDTAAKKAAENNAAKEVSALDLPSNSKGNFIG